MKTVSKLAQIEKELEAIANELEKCGFEEQAQALDTAACHVEEIKEGFAAVS